MAFNVWRMAMAMANGNSNGKWQWQQQTANSNGKWQIAMAMATANVSSRQQTMKEVEGLMLDGWQEFGVARRVVSTCSWCRYA